MSEKIAIHCPTKELAIKVGDKMKGSFGADFQWSQYEGETCLNDRGNVISFCDTEWYKHHNYTIIPAEEWLFEKQREEVGKALGDKEIKERELKVGNRVEVVCDGWDFRKGSKGVIDRKADSSEEIVWLIADDGRKCPIKIEDLKLIESEDSMKFKEGGKVILKSYGRFDGYNLPSYAQIGDEGEIITVGSETDITVSFNNNDSFGFQDKDIDICLKLKGEGTAPTYSVPLREGDKVRYVLDFEYFGVKTGGIGVVQENNSFNPYVLWEEAEGNKVWAFNEKKLELIPTEKDIVVGSVWERKDNKGIRTVGYVIDSPTNCPIMVKETSYKYSIKYFLEDCKLIHRGDEAVDCPFEKNEHGELIQRIVYQAPAGKTIISCGEIEIKQTNKKEKKMKKLKLANKIIKEGDAVIDRECNNEGIVVAVYPESEQVSYRDYKNDEIETVNVRRLYQQFVSPKPKPVAKKKKVVKKKVK